MCHSVKMKFRSPLPIFVALALSLGVPSASALTMQQFAEVCRSASEECSDHPMLRAYVGGALDLLATLDERTDYLESIYCEEPSELFDVRAIIQFMSQRSDEYAADNAMLVLVRYFEERGGCDSE